VLRSKVIISDIWNYREKGMMKVGVAPIIDPNAPFNPKDPEGVIILGAIVVAYAQTAQEAQRASKLLGTEIAYFDSNRVVATSFTRGGGGAEDTAKATELSAQLAAKAVGPDSGKKTITIDGADYIAAAVKMPRS
jgi:hypothetical protein